MAAAPRDSRQESEQRELFRDFQDGPLTADGPDADPDGEAGRDPDRIPGQDMIPDQEPGPATGMGSPPDLDAESDAETGTLAGLTESFRELRPPRLLRFWQLAPIVVLAVLGSLMFAFPLAFEFGDGGAVVAMLGLLISCCAAGWAMMAARRVGYTLPGLPPRGSGRRPDWRLVLLYVAVVGTVAALAFWRVARLR